MINKKNQTKQNKTKNKQLTYTESCEKADIYIITFCLASFHPICVKGDN